MTKKTLERDKKYIETHVGEIPTSKMILFYERYLHGSDEYGLGAEFEDMAYLIYRKHIPQKYCSCQTDHKKNIQYLRFRPHTWGAKEIANARGVINLGDVKEMYKLYTCNNKIDSGHSHDDKT